MHSSIITLSERLQYGCGKEHHKEFFFLNLQKPLIRYKWSNFHVFFFIGGLGGLDYSFCTLAKSL